MTLVKIGISLYVVLLHALAQSPLFSDANRSHWELGAGMGALVIPHYRGSDQEAVYVAPIPYVRYIGKRLRIDREGARYYLYEGKAVYIDISTAFALAVDSDKNSAREGMSDLDSILEIGPRIQWKLYESQNKNFRVRCALPFRKAFASDLNSVDTVGWVIAPYMQVRYFKTGWESAFSAGPLWGSESYHDYFYSVKPENATLNRPAYNARSGFSGSRAVLTLSHRFDKVFFGLFAKYDNLNNATFMDSPLIRQNDSFLIGVALSWVFKTRQK